MKFNADGSLDTGKNKEDDGLELIQEETPELSLLRLLTELPFPIGRKLIAETLKGEDNSRIRKLRLNLCEHHGSLDLYDDRDIYELIDSMVFDDMIQITKSRSSKYYPVVSATKKGIEFMKNPVTKTKKEGIKEVFDYDEVTEKDREVISHLNGFLGELSEQQGKAIISDNKNILCVAGAGSGKTTVLTKRIEFLSKMRGINPEEILAITFTRKARREMMDRLQGLPVNIETFNSFCEKYLKRNEGKFLGKRKQVISFRDKIRITTRSLENLNYNPWMAVNKYFGSKKGKDDKTLFFSMIGDVFGLMDHYKNNERNIEQFKEAIVSKANSKDKPIAVLIYNLIKEIEKLKEEQGFRDYTDQIVDSLKIMDNNSEAIPRFKHILVDEYQDVNDIQVRLLEVLNPENLFVVGDPRQSIYGWRGSKVKNILKFPEIRNGCSVIQLTENHRSVPDIVRCANQTIASMKMSDLISNKDDKKTNMTLMKHKDDASENMFITQSILSRKDVDMDDIFVLARTNKKVQEISEHMAQYGVPHISKRSEDMTETLEPEEGKVTISTVHAIKGLEAKIVYIAGVNSKMFPCLVSEHPVQDLARIDFEYEKQDEELRLLYVAMTRAKEELHINFSGRLSKFVTEDTKKYFKFINLGKENIERDTTNSTFDLLKEWRMRIAKEKKILPYMVLPDRTLIQLVKRNPETTEELNDIVGLGPTKIMNYGEELIDLLRGVSR